MTERRPAATIGEVVDRLDEIVAAARRAESPLGYFPALYRQVTVRVRQGIERGEFEDAERMERLDVIFANRYLQAYDGFHHGAAITGAWAFTFSAGGQWWPIVLQHLLLGINAHINLDLAIATAEVAGSAAALPGMRGDFDRINGILAGLVGEVKEDLARIWTTLRVFSRALGGVEDAIINFSLEKARCASWASAETLAALAPSDWPEAIARCDRRVVEIGRLVRHPGLVAATVNGLVRLGEIGGVARKIDILASVGPSSSTV